VLDTLSDKPELTTLARDYLKRFCQLSFQVLDLLVLQKTFLPSCTAAEFELVQRLNFTGILMDLKAAQSVFFLFKKVLSFHFSGIC
jgi:hypothetical protein